MSNTPKPEKAVHYDSCACLPGTLENGFHEVRDPKCIQLEKMDFKKAIEDLNLPE